MSEKVKEYQELSPIQFSIINELKKIIPEYGFRINGNNFYINNPETFNILEKSIENILKDLECDNYTLDQIYFLINKTIIIKLGVSDEYIKIFSDYNFKDFILNKIEKILG